ncbi:MAG: tRNA (cytidine(34)-2'-O)-methyltransferase [Alphaproteobacteria bacterium]
MPSLALYQPDIPQNVGAAMRLAACLGLDLHIIEPCGFPWDERKIRQSGMDYTELAQCRRHNSWQTFREQAKHRRIILMTTKADKNYTDFDFQPGDILLAGRESAGVPQEIHAAADACICIPMQGAARSLNIVTAAAMIAGEALRQINLHRQCEEPQATKQSR